MLLYRSTEYGERLTECVYSVCQPRWFLAIDKACVGRHFKINMISLDRVNRRFIVGKAVNRRGRALSSLYIMITFYFTRGPYRVLVRSPYPMSQDLHSFAMFGGNGYHRSLYSDNTPFASSLQVHLIQVEIFLFSGIPSKTHDHSSFLLLSPFLTVSRIKCPR